LFFFKLALLSELNHKKGCNIKNKIKQQNKLKLKLKLKLGNPSQPTGQMNCPEKGRLPQMFYFILL